MVNGSNVAIAEKGFTELPRILKDQKVKNSFVPLTVIVHGKIKINAVAKTHLIG